MPLVLVSGSMATHTDVPLHTCRVHSFACRRNVLLSCEVPADHAPLVFNASLVSTNLEWLSFPVQLGTRPSWGNAASTSLADRSRCGTCRSQIRCEVGISSLVPAASRICLPRCQQGAEGGFKTKRKGSL